LVGYVILVAVILAVQFVAPLRAWLAGPALRVEFPAVETARGYAVPAGPGRVIHPLSHAGALLAYAAIASFVVYRWQGRYAPGAALRILRGTGRGLMLSSLGVLAMVGLAATMADSGMTEALARGLAESVGRAYPVAAPWIGGLGAFMTGSNTNSNVVFTLLQRRTAELLGLSVPWVLAAQTAGGAVTSVIAPTKVIVGASTGGMAGREGQVLRGLAGYIAALLVGVSVLAWIFSR
jgi:lactate permease